MTDKYLIFTCIIAIIICSSLITDMILTAKEEAFAACIHANSAATPDQLDIICGE